MCPSTCCAGPDGASRLPARASICPTSLRRLEADEANPANGNIPLQVDYAAAPGTLPTLRFGHTYRFRARAVDLAGNSVPFTKSGPFTWATPEVTYRRFEPVPSPVLVPTGPGRRASISRTS